MAKKSPAKVKKMAAEAKRSAILSRESKKLLEEEKDIIVRDLVLERCEVLDGEWRKIGLAVAERRALVDDGLYQLADLRKVSLAVLKDLHGMSPNAIRILIREMNKLDLSFRK